MAAAIQLALPQQFVATEPVYGLAERVKELLERPKLQKVCTSLCLCGTLWFALSVYSTGSQVAFAAIVCMQTDAVRKLGLTGIGGIGKTTLATALYHHLLSSSALRACFLPGIRSEIERTGTTRLQRKMLKYLAHHDVEPTDGMEGDSRDLSPYVSKQRAAM